MQTSISAQAELRPTNDTVIIALMKNMIFSECIISLAGCRRGLVTDQFNFYDDDWFWAFAVVSGRGGGGGAPFFSAAVGAWAVYAFFILSG